MDKDKQDAPEAKKDQEPPLLPNNWWLKSESKGKEMGRARLEQEGKVLPVY